MAEIKAGTSRMPVRVTGRLGTAVQLAVPRPEHFVPALDTLALRRADDDLWYFNDVAVGGSLTMTSFRIG